MLPFVSIVLPTYQGAAHLRDTLPALRAQNYDGEVEIVAIDSGSRDQSVALLERFGARVTVIAPGEFGHGRTRNLGVRLARGEIVVFLSQDARPVGPFWLRDLVAALRDPALGAVFARQLPRPDATPIERFFHAEIYPPRSRTTRPRRGPITASDVFFSNVCSAARREVCARFPFDETLIMSEDQVFARDLLRGGYAVRYAAQVQVIHSHAYDLATLFRRNFDSGHSLRALPGAPWHRQWRRATRFWARETVFLARGRHFAALAGAPLYEGTRFAALLAGTLAPHLPRALRRKFSLHRAYWDAQD